MPQHMPKGIGLAYMRGFGHKVNYDLGIAGGFEDMAVSLILIPQQGGIDDVAIMRYRDLSPRILAQKRLGICRHRRTAC